MSAEILVMMSIFMVFMFLKYYSLNNNDLLIGYTKREQKINFKDLKIEKINLPEGLHKILNIYILFIWPVSFYVYNEFLSISILQFWFSRPMLINHIV